ncbi:hypothetical protein [Pseudoduganella armeniaca]|uniref:hypothetical protein n=1 Tax=Pseudoduganella armeniaca TaxID=2072590 RepID=UPI0011B23C3F|nr:hypothetical protein [Pseudoduganella armeniaca]
MASELGKLVPGDSQECLAEVALPQDVPFTGHGLVLAYPKHSVHFIVSSCRGEVVQQPSFLQLARSRPAVCAGRDWSSCTPELWGGALPIVSRDGVGVRSRHEK